MNESGSRRVRAMSKLMTPSVARAGVMISPSAAISASLLSGLEWILKRRMTIARPVVETALKHTMLFRHGASRPGETLVACPGLYADPSSRRGGGPGRLPGPRGHPAPVQLAAREVSVAAAAARGGAPLCHRVAGR